MKSNMKRLVVKETRYDREEKESGISTGEHTCIIPLHPGAVTGGDASKVQGFDLQQASQSSETALCHPAAVHLPIT